VLLSEHPVDAMGQCFSGLSAPAAKAAPEVKTAASRVGETGLTLEQSIKSTTGKIVLVTGTAGFVGFHTAMALKKRGDGVIGIDNFNSYYPVGLKRDRAATLERAGVLTLEMDLNDGEALRALFDECRFTHVLALAAQAGVRYATKHPQSYVSSNIAGFVELLEVCRSTPDPKPRVVYASSSSVYGLNTKVPFAETDRVDNPASLYAATKKANEMIAHTYKHIYGLSVIGLRFFTVYGPWGRPDMAAFHFTKKIEKGEAIKIFQGPGGSELERDFTYIDDIVTGCLGSVDRVTASTKEEAECHVINLGNKDPVTVSYLVDCIEEALGRKAIRNHMPMPPTGDVLKTSADVTMAARELGYAPTTPLREGIQQFIDWYKEYYKNGMDQEMADYVPM